MIGIVTWPPFIIVHRYEKGSQVTKPIILVKICYNISKQVNWLQGDGFSSMGTWMGAIKLAIAVPLGLVALIFSIVGLLILYG